METKAWLVHKCSACPQPELTLDTTMDSVRSILFHCYLQDNMGSPQILHKIMGHVAHKQGEPVANVADIMQVKILPKKMLKLL